MAHDVAVRRLYPTLPARISNPEAPRTNFDLAGHLSKPPAEFFTPRVFWPAACKTVALTARRRVNLSSSRQVQRLTGFASRAGDSGEEHSSDQSEFDLDSSMSTDDSNADASDNDRTQRNDRARAKKRFNVDKFL